MTDREKLLEQVAYNYDKARHEEIKYPTIYALSETLSNELYEVSDDRATATKINYKKDGTTVTFICSECNESVYELANYCENCGAKFLDEEKGVAE